MQHKESVDKGSKQGHLGDKWNGGDKHESEVKLMMTPELKVDPSSRLNDALEKKKEFSRKMQH